MFGKRMVYLLLALAVISVGFLGWKLMARGAYESAEYTVIEADGSFEIREYPDLMMATTNMQFESPGDDGSFMRLFRYISGDNDGDQKVAMTTPVFMEPESGGEEAGQMGFVLPKKVTEQGIPAPAGETVEIKKRPGGRFAVYRYAGRMNDKTNAASEEKLRRWMENRDLIGEGNAEFAGYDAPWTPGPLRRNEILIRLK